MKESFKNLMWDYFPLYRFTYFRLLVIYCDLFCESSVVSYQKSGHTWLRVMLAKVISMKYKVKKLDLDIVRMAGFKKEIPKIAIFHSLAGIAFYLINLKKLKFTSIYSKSEKIKIRNSLKKKKNVLLVRDPKDVIVSLYFELTRRHNIYRGTISQFIKEKYTLKKIIRYMNMWEKEMSRRPNDFLLIRYEDMKKDTYKELKKVTSFLGMETDDYIIKEAVKFGSIDNMRNIEKSDIFKDNRLRAKNPKDKESYKVRKGKVGGYKDYLTKEDIEYIKKRISLNLNKCFRY